MPLGFEVTPHDDAIRLIRRKPIVSREIFDQLLPTLRARAFLISGEIPADIVGAVRDRIADLPAGGNWEEIKSDIITDLSPHIEDAETRAETLLQVHGYQAYQANNWAEAQDSEVITHLQYMTTEDDKVRDTHAALNGIILPKDDPFWRDHYPPWEWGCRCNARGITQEMVDQEREYDRKRNPEDRLIIEGAVADKLRQGEIIRGTESFFIGVEHRPNAYRFDPESLRITPAALLSAYDPQTRLEFERFARETEIVPGVTVWEWMNGKSVSQ